MKASKEDCRLAKFHLAMLLPKPNGPLDKLKAYGKLVEFLDLCEKRLPSEKAIADNLVRKNKKSKVQ